MVEKKNPELFDANPDLKADYTFIQMLGEGGMGQVYLARQKKLNRLVAIKTLLPSKLTDKKELERLKREATVLSRLSHPNLVEIYSVIEWDGLIYIITEYAEGKSLREYLKAEPIPLADSFAIIESICSTLGYVHSMGMVHRDIKPGNILVQKGNKVRVIDFGLAKQYDKSTMYENITREGECIGTPMYMSPEALRGRQLGPTCDIYALGILFYELITLEPPLSGEAVEIARAHMENEIPLISEIVANVNDKVDDFFCKCLAVEPESRFASMEAMAKALRKIKQDILAIDVSRAPEPSYGTDISMQKTIASRRMDQSRKGPLPAKHTKKATIRSRNATKTQKKSKINSCKRYVGTKAERTSSNRKRLAIISIVITFLLIGTALFFRSFSEKSDSQLRFPHDLKYSQKKVGAIKLSWGTDNDVFSSLILEDTETQKSEKIAVKGRQVTLTGLMPGRKYKFYCIGEGNSKTIYKSLTGPYSALEVSNLTPPATFNGTGKITFNTIDDISVDCTYTQDDTKIETTFSDTSSKIHVFKFEPGKGPLFDLKLIGTDSTGRFTIELPYLALAKHISKAMERINGNQIALACEQPLKPECYGAVTPQQRSEKLKRFIFELCPDFKNYLLLYPLLPSILLDSKSYTLELKQKMFDLMDMDVLTITYGTSWKHSIDAVMSDNFKKITPQNHDLYFGKSPETSLHTIFNYKSGSVKSENPQLLWPYDLPKTDSGKLRERLLKISYTNYECTKVRTMKMNLLDYELHGIKRAAVKITTPLYRESFKLLLEINGHPPIPFLSPESAFSEERADDPEKDHVKTIYVSRQIPVEYLIEGENFFKFSLSAPLKIPSAMLPALKVGTLSLQKSH